MLVHKCIVMPRGNGDSAAAMDLALMWHFGSKGRSEWEWEGLFGEGWTVFGWRGVEQRIIEAWLISLRKLNGDGFFLQRESSKVRQHK